MLTLNIYSRNTLLSLFFIVFSFIPIQNGLAANMATSITSPDQSSILLRIAVSSNFTPILKKLLRRFENKTGIKSQVISAGTGTLFLQIKHGAPFDIFIAADSIRTEQLEEQKLIIEGSRHTYAIGQLALYSNHKTAQLSDLQNIPKRFAIANPEVAPYGKAAKEALEYLNLWQPYQSSLIKGINVNQTFAQIRSQSVNIGLVANSQLVFNGLSGIVIPAHYHKAIQQQLVIIKASHNIHNAQRLSDFLLSESIQKEISTLGYIPASQLSSQHLSYQLLAKDNNAKS